MPISYDELFKRNEGYIDKDVQNTIKHTALLIAGCGVGSTIAEAAARIGFQNFTLVDADTVDTHNLNRQAFDSDDIGHPKVNALSRRLLRINPNIQVQSHNAWINDLNAAQLIHAADLIFDTIDFLDIKGIVALHDEANRQAKPIISCVSAGWGAAGVFFPPHTDNTCHFRRLFGLPDTGSVENASYVKHFAVFMRRIGENLDQNIVRAMQKALTIMEDGTPCPAPHVVAGSFSVAALAVTMAVRIIAGKAVTTAPCMILADLGALASSTGIDLSPE